MSVLISSTTRTTIENMHSNGTRVTIIDNKINLTAGEVEVEANLQKQISDHSYFRPERATETLTNGEIQRITFIILELAIVTLQWAFAAVGKLVFC